MFRSLSERGGNILLLTVIAIAAITLSILSYELFSLNSDKIAGLASEDIRSTVRIQAHDISNLLTNTLGQVSSNLQILTNVPLVEREDLSAQPIFESAQKSTSNLTDGYYWINQDGIVLTYSEVDTGRFPDFRGIDLSDRDYFKIPRDTHMPFYSSVIDSNDDIKRMYVSYPILVGDDDGSGSSRFNGVIVAAIPATNVGAFLTDQLASELPGSLGLIDRNGVILYSNNHTNIGTNFFGPEIQSVIPPDIKGAFNAIIQRSLSGISGVEDIAVAGATTTIAYQPVDVNNEHLWTLYITTPNTLSQEVNALIAEQRNISTAIVASIGAVAVGIAFMVITWNKRLSKTVQTRTSELNTKTRELERANTLLAESNENLVVSNKRLEDANEQLQAHDKMQKDFINIAAHELRTPTQAILGYSELIESGLAMGGKDLEGISRNAKRLQRLTEDILDVSRIETNSLKLNKERFSLNEVISFAISDAKTRKVADGKVKFDYEPGDGEIVIEADRDRIIQAISNILDNAVKFTKDAGGTISVWTEKQAGQVYVRVKDAGKGIDPEIMPKLFTKFTTKSEKGTGLGLYIAKSIVEAHGGTIQAENNKDGKSGATFSFSLPLPN